jgi:prepilin-type N-terminal cleavage/methylation domain-containing protein
MMKNKQQGFSLIELMIVLAIISVMMQMKIKADINADIFSQAEADVKRTMQEIGNIQAAASGYLADTGEYPDFANNCNDAITVLKNAPTAYLNYITTTSPYNTQYITECNTTTFTVKVKSDKDFAAPYIAAQYPGSTILAAPDDDTSASSIPRPLSLSQFLSLDGSRAMQGDLDMDDHAIKNVQDIDFNGQDLKLGIGKFVSMGSVSFNSLTSTIDKPDCTQGGITGTAKIILIIHGITTIIGGSSGIRNVSWSASFIELTSAQQWRLSTTGLSAITGVAETFCDYGSWNR